MRVALAQVRSETGDVEANVAHHRAVLRALGPEVDLVAFPELSLTNYAPEVAAETALRPDDDRLAPFQRFADATGTAVAVGAPLQTAGAPAIAMLTFTAGAPPVVTGKHWLHADERAVFSPSGGAPGVLGLAERVGVAICYELSVPAHADALVAAGATLYLAAAAKTARGVAEAHATLAETARRTNLPTLMVNSVGTCEGVPAGGRSVAFDAAGARLGELGPTADGVLLVDTTAGTAAAL